jgi:uncharacterized damage-inducible protein DinB
MTNLTSVYPDWDQHNARIRDGVRGLTDQQLAISAGPDHAPIWALAAHTAGTRVYWLCGVFGEAGAETTPWHSPLTDEGWEDDLSHPRSGDELAWVLDTTWEIVRGCLERWTTDDLELAAVRTRDDGAIQRHTRASILNRLFTHEAYHAGEISQLMGVHGLDAIDIWAKPWIPEAAR